MFVLEPGRAFWLIGFCVALGLNVAIVLAICYPPYFLSEGYSVAQAGWMGVTTRVNERGQVEGTCVGTTLASDHVYYYNRPQSVFATHGYGPVLLAGAEMIRLLQNPAIDIQYKLRTYHYVPKGR